MRPLMRYARDLFQDNTWFPKYHCLVGKASWSTLPAGGGVTPSRDVLRVNKLAGLISCSTLRSAQKLNSSLLYLFLQPSSATLLLSCFIPITWEASLTPFPDRRCFIGIIGFWSTAYEGFTVVKLACAELHYSLSTALV